MRYAFLAYFGEERAPATMWFAIGRELVKRGHQVTLVVLGPHRFRTGWKSQDGVRILRTPRGVGARWFRHRWDPIDILARLWHFAREPYDVLIGVDCPANVYIPFQVLRGRKTLRIAGWGDRWGEGGLSTGNNRFAIQQQLEEKWEKQMMLDADGVILSSRTLGALATDWGIPDRRLCLIRHGSDIDRIHPIPIKAARRQMGLDVDQPVICYLGHGWPPPLSSFLPVFQRLVQRYPQLKILIIGPCKNADQEKIDLAGLRAHFIYTGFVPSTELKLWLACANICLIPLSGNSVNDYYRWPAKMGDYLAAGRPVIAPDVGETAQFIREENVGLVVQADLSDLGDRICDLIEDQALAKQLGSQARRVAEECLAWPLLTDRFEQFIENLNGHQ